MRLTRASLSGLFALFCCVSATYHHLHLHSLRCECNGRSRYCLRDAEGLRCVDCEGNTEGRHCERCRAGFYLQDRQKSCSPCLCHVTGSLSSQCDSRGRCSCKEGFRGVRCDLCEDGQKVGADGCTRSRQLRQDPGSPSCFCFGHSSECSPQSDHYVHNITSTFSHGPDGWRAATVDGETPRNVHIRWLPNHQDVEVISSSSRPVYLYAPAPFLGDQLHSYGQNLSFSLRLDKGVRQPSTSDVILEGAGLSVSTSLGDLRHSVACRHKRYYSFRLDESQWSPRLSSFMFQKLLQNLTAVKIRASFGHNGRGYLDSVSLVSARPGVGTVPAGWARSCRCPPSLEGPQCERCAPGHRRSEPGRGPFSDCQPCQCPRGSCDAQSGECLSSDDNSPLCQHGYSGPTCTDCSEGFYRETTRGDGFPAPCQPCSCDPRGSSSSQCDSEGTCPCKPGFEGQKCGQTRCPSCFSPVSAQLEQFVLRLQDLQQQLSAPVDTKDMEDALRAAQRQLDDLQDDHQTSKGSERRLQKRLSSLGSEQLILGQELDGAARSCRSLEGSRQKFTEQRDVTEELIRDMKRLLEQAQRSLSSADLPQADSPPAESTPLSSLLQSALDLLQKHQSDADSTETKANEALKDSEQSVVLAQSVLDREKKVQKTTQDLQDMLDRISTEVKDLETRAPQVSSAAKDQSKMAARLLQDIVEAEEDLPAPLKAEAEDLLSRLDLLKTDADRKIKDLEKLKAAVEPKQADAKDLLSRGKAAQKDLDKLVDRVDQAKADTEEALRRISGNSKDLDDALGTLRGFEEQMDGAKAQSDAAVARLPVINATVQAAKRDNAAARGLVDEVSQELDRAQDSRDQLQDHVDQLQDSWTRVPPDAGLVDQTRPLQDQAEDLRDDSSSTAADVKRELDLARDLKDQASQAAEDAQDALDNSLRSRDAVRRTLRDVTNMILSLNASEPVDTSRLEQLEQSLGAAQKDVALSLRPRLEQLQHKEQVHRRYLRKLNHDVSTILKDIQNIEDILDSVPQGCYNNQPLEEA